MDQNDGGLTSGQRHEAVTRLYELAREGDTASGEYQQLDTLVYDGLARVYGEQSDDEPERSGQYG